MKAYTKLGIFILWTMFVISILMLICMSVV